jgi:hypothetical protein
MYTLIQIFHISFNPINVLFSHRISSQDKVMLETLLDTLLLLRQLLPTEYVLKVMNTDLRLLLPLLRLRVSLATLFLEKKLLGQTLKTTLVNDLLVKQVVLLHLCMPRILFVENFSTLICINASVLPLSQQQLLKQLLSQEQVVLLSSCHGICLLFPVLTLKCPTVSVRDTIVGDQTSFRDKT